MANIKDIKINCVVCGKDHWITKGNKNIKCCSRGCANTYRASKIPRPSCSFCGKIINRRLSHCFRNGNKKIFCGKICEGNARKNRVLVTCDVCHTSFERQKSLAYKHKRTFCSKKCETIGLHDFRKSIGPHYRSYGECAILHLLRKNFPHIDFHPNDRKQLYGYEIDIWIPSMRIGIEYNGPHHFKPVYGEKIFIKTKKSDEKKRKIANGKRIQIIDINAIKSISYTHKSIVTDLFSNLCKQLNLSPTTLDFDPQIVLKERNTTGII